MQKKYYICIDKRSMYAMDRLFAQMNTIINYKTV